MQVLKDEIRNKILAAAENQFYQKGFKDTTTRGIAKEVGISVSNLYLYYENKEAIFYSITDGFYNYFINGFKNFIKHHDDNDDIYSYISHLIKKNIITDQKKFVIIADKSQGTRYEGFKQLIINILANHMKIQVKEGLADDDLLFYIIARNFIEGVIEIAKNYKDECWLENNINILIQYHLKGMKHLM